MGEDVGKLGEDQSANAGAGRGDTCKQLGSDIAAVYAGEAEQFNFGAAGGEHMAATVQEGDAAVLEFLDKAIAVVVTENAEAAVGGGQLRDHPAGEGNFACVVALVVDEVAGHDDEVGGFGADAGD